MTYPRLIINPALIIIGVPFGLSLSKPDAARPSTRSGRAVFKGRVNSAADRRDLPKGFTLLEVLIALSILAILMTGLIKIAAQNTQNLWYLENSLIAEQVAHNRLLALQLGEARPEQDDGWDSMAGRRWFWQIQRQRVSALVGVTAYRIKVFREGEASPYIDFLGYLPNVS